MKAEDLFPQLNELYLPSPDDFALVNVPEMRFMMIDGHGAADRTALDHAVRWLFAVAFPIRRFAREKMGRNFVEPPLEGLWWAEDPADFVHGNRDRLSWRMMIIYEPDWLTAELFDDAVATVRARLGDPPPGLRVESYAEGRSAQIMYVGPPESQGPTVRRLHEEFLPAHGLVASGRHHEIYLTDPKRVAPDRMKTVLRQPVRKTP